jgi:hypothetical protein
MSFPTTPMGIWEEIQVAELDTKARLRSWDDLVGKYVGPFFERNTESSEHRYDPENHAYEVVRFYLPQLIYSNPRVRVRSRMYGADRAALKFQHVVNQWVQDRYFGEFLLMPVADSLFGYGATLMTREEHPFLKLENGKPAMTVAKSRISPHAFFSDPLATDRESRRYQGHFYARDKDDALEYAQEHQDEGWNPDVISGLPTGTAMDRLHRPGAWRERLDREELVFCEVWVPEVELGEPEEGYNGALYTLAVGVGDNGEAFAEFPRDPQPYFGPNWGPYNLYDIFPVPDRKDRLAPLVATEGQARDWNRHARGVSNSAARYKRIILVDSDNPNLVEQVRDESHDEVIPVSGLEKDQVIPLEVGGITEQNIAYLEICKERVERVSGMSEAQRGQVQGQATATEAAIAAAAGDLGTEFVKLQEQRAVRRDLLGVAWHVNYDDEFRQALGPDAAEELGVELAEGEIPVLKGGNPEIPFEELALELEPMSMERVTNAQNQRRMVEAFTFALQLAQTKLTIPGFDADGFANAIGEAMNVPGLGEYIAGVPVAGSDEAMQAVQMMSPTAQALQGSAGAGSRSNGRTREGTYAPARELIGRQTGRMAQTDMAGTTGGR